MSQPPLSTWKIYRWPLTLAIISISGLLFALLGDGVWDTASWVLLGVPLVLILWLLVRRL